MQIIKLTIAIILVFKLSNYSASAQTPAELDILKTIIEEKSKESWEYSYRGGYVCEFKYDINEDGVAEKFIMFTVDSGRWHVFSSEDVYIGKIQANLHNKIGIKHTNRGISFVNAYAHYGQSDSRAIVEQRLTTKGVEIVITDGDRVDIEEFEKITNIKSDWQYVPVAISYTTLENYLNVESAKWKKYTPKEWSVADSYPVLEEDKPNLDKLKFDFTEESIQNQLAGFTDKKALRLADDKKEVLQNSVSDDLKNNKSNSLWIYLSIIFVFLLFMIIFIKRKSKLARS